SVLDKNRATSLETLFHQGVIGGSQKFAGDSHGKNTENCATFCTPLAKVAHSLGALWVFVP
ncbi:hypothetical protein ABZQ34_28525, partial [Pseudomonas aeruginosa]